MITPEYIECAKTELSCKLATLGNKYTNDMFLGKGDCRLEDLIMAANLFEVLCLIKFDSGEEEGEVQLRCSDEANIGSLVREIEKYLGRITCTC